MAALKQVDTIDSLDFIRHFVSAKPIFETVGYSAHTECHHHGNFNCCSPDTGANQWQLMIWFIWILSFDLFESALSVSFI